MDLQQRIDRDIEFLEKAFPNLQEQFPDFRWAASESFVADYCIAFQNVIFVAIESIHVHRKGDGTEVYSVNLPHDEWMDFPTIYAAVEFIGRKARALTPINASAEALEARFGGAS